MMLRPEDDSGESASIPREELTHWLEAVRDLPDVRMQKVLRARHAIQHHTYDDEGVVDETIERLCLDLETAVGDAE